MSIRITLLVLGLTCFGFVQPALARPESADLPKADKVLADAVKALGGRAAIDKIKTIHTVATMEAMGQKMDMTNSCSRAGGRLSVMKSPMGEITSGTDGKVAWRKTPMGYMILEGDDSGQVRHQAAMHLMMIDPERTAREDLKSIEVSAKEKFDSRECYKLATVNKEGKPGCIFFDAATGLPAGFEQEETKKGRSVRSTMILSDWKAIEGVKFFHKVTMDMPADGKPPAGRAQMVFAKVEVNTIKDDAFALPEEVRKLAAAMPPAGTVAPEIKLEDLSPAEQAEAKKMLEGMKQMPASQLKPMVDRLDMAAPHMQGEKQKTMKYIVQELRKQLAAKAK